MTAHAEQKNNKKKTRAEKQIEKVQWIIFDLNALIEVRIAELHEQQTSLSTLEDAAQDPYLVELDPRQPFLEEAMGELAELMQRLLEIQSGGRQRSPELVAEDERLMDGLQKRYLAGQPLFCGLPNHREP